MSTQAPIKTPIPAPWRPTKSRFRNFTLSTLIFALSIRSSHSGWLYICRGRSTFVARTLQITTFLCKTNPISTGAKKNQTPYLKKLYENLIPPRTTKNEPKTNPNEPNFGPPKPPNLPKSRPSVEVCQNTKKKCFLRTNMPFSRVFCHMGYRTGREVVDNEMKFWYYRALIMKACRSTLYEV